MDWNKYQKEAFKTNAHLETLEEGNIHMVLGMVTEVAELADVFKKNLAYGKEIDWKNVKEEIGDIFWYIAGFAEFNDIDIPRVWENNIEKLRSRYPEGFNSESAQVRDLDREAGILDD